jgi:outer membrane receptor protein involved in Fe transport
MQPVLKPFEGSFFVRRFRWFRALGALALTLLWAAPATAARPRPDIRAGQPLAEALEAFRDQGLQVVFTSRLVAPELTVEAVPEADGRSARALLAELLRPHGLAVREAAGGVLVVVEGPRSTADESDGAVVETFQLSDEIVVRPSRVTLLGDEPASTFSLDRRDIESLPKLGGDLFRAASLLPGVTGNDVSAAFSVHGGRRDEVRVLLDGQELYVPYHLADFDDALSIVPGRLLAGADLQTGAYPAPHGDRMSAVLELDTVIPQTAPRAVLGLSVLDAVALGSGSLADGRGGWLVSGRRGSLDFAGEVVGDENPAFWDLFATLDLPAGARGRWTLRALDAHDGLQLATEDEDGFERLDTDYRSTYAWLTHTAALSDRLVVASRGSWSQVRRSRDGVGAEEEGGFGLLDRRRLEVLELSQEWDLALSRDHLLRWGAEGRQYDTEIAYRRRLDPRIDLVAPFSPPRLEALDADLSLASRHLGLWASDRWTRGRFTGELGLRFDRHTETDDSLWSPRASVAWRLTPTLVGRAAWGRYYQSQRPYELGIADGERRLQKAELSEHFVVGLEAFLDRHDAAWGRLGLDLVRVELYRRDIDRPRPRYENLLEPLNFLQEIEPDRVRITPSRSRAEGVETLVRGRIGDGERVRWWASYAWARAVDEIPALGGDEVPRSLDQPHTAVMNLDLTLPHDWRLNLAWRYRSGWPTTPVTVETVPAPEDPDDPESSEDGELVPTFGRLNSQRLPDYHRLDLRASREILARRGRLIFYLDVQNLYDRDNVAGFDPIFDDDVFTLEPEIWPGIFPSLGVRWEF